MYKSVTTLHVYEVLGSEICEDR